MERRLETQSQSIDVALQKWLEKQSQTTEAAVEQLLPQKQLEEQPRCLLGSSFSVQNLLEADSGIESSLATVLASDVRHLVDNGTHVLEQLLANERTHLEVAQALCQTLPEAPASSTGAVVTYIFSSPEIQLCRRNGKFDKIVSEELRWDGVMDTQFQYSFNYGYIPMATARSSRVPLAFSGS